MSTFAMDDLMALLVAKVGLPSQEITDNPQRSFADLGLDSLAFLQLQSEIKTQYGVELPGDRPLTYTFGEILTTVNNCPARVEEAVA